MTCSSLGSPLTKDGYALCLYNAGALTMVAGVEPGGVCAGKPCWKAGKKAFQFTDKDLTPDGVRSSSSARVHRGRRRCSSKGKGSTLRCRTVLVHDRSHRGPARKW
jgi:hypothetical protein